MLFLGLMKQIGEDRMDKWDGCKGGGARGEGEEERRIGHCN